MHGKQKVRENGGLGRKANFLLLMIYVGKRSSEEKEEKKKGSYSNAKTSWGV